MKYVLILLLMISIFVQPSHGASAGDDDSPPPGGGGGGGGSPEFYDYYVPLVFDDTHPDGYSEITVWLIQGSLLFTSFSLNDAGQTSAQVSEPTKITFNPIENEGLTNGSLIRTTTPALVTGHRSTQDIFSDKSFAYSILIDRMMGFEYVSPVNGWVNLFTLSPQTSVRIEKINGESRTQTITEGGTTGSFEVQVGDKINSSSPTNGAFISYEQGTKASMTVPKYLRGNHYIFDLSSNSPNTDEIDQSYLQIIPDEPTEITLRDEFGFNQKMNIFGLTHLNASDGWREIISSRGSITITLHQEVTYSTLKRQSMVQFIDSNEMRSGELFAAPSGYSSHLATINDETRYVTGYYNDEIGDYNVTIKEAIIKNSRQVLTFNGLTDTTFVLGNHSSFGYLSSPGKISHPMAPSQAFLNLPLNPSTTRFNVTGLQSTWFRFPNLSIQKIEILPGPAEQYTGQTIRIEFKSNGTLPASTFRVQITIDSEIVTDEVYDFLGVNESLIFEYSEFISFGAESLNITARIDVEDNVNEINESDNADELNIEVQENFRLKWSIIGFSILIILFIIAKIRRKLQRNSELRRSHVDAIITAPVEVEDNE